MKVFLWFSIVSLLITACKEELHPLSLPSEPNCQNLSIETNIVGSWHFESTYPAGSSISSGTVTFRADQTISDPDHLFENTVNGKPVDSKAYRFGEDKLSPNTGKVFMAYINSMSGQQIIYFTVVSNECTRIHLSLYGSKNNANGFILTR